MAREIEEIYEKAIEQTKPDLLEAIWEQQGKPMDEPDEIVKQEYRKEKGTKKIAFSGMLGVAAAIFLLFVLYRPTWVNTTITIDVNPGFEMQLDKNDVVREVTGVNEEAKQILNQTKVTGLDVEEAVDKISENLVKSGYVKKNTVVLVSVEGEEENSTKNMKNRVKARIEETCKNQKPIVFTQSIEKKEETEKLAEKYGISKGRAALICNMEKKKKEWTVKKLASMTIEELVTSAEQKGVLENTQLEKNVQKEKKKEEQNTHIPTSQKKEEKEQAIGTQEKKKTESEKKKKEKTEKEQKKKENEQKEEDTKKEDKDKKQEKKDREKKEDKDQRKPKEDTTEEESSEYENDEEDDDDKEDKHEEHDEDDRDDDDRGKPGHRPGQPHHGRQ